MDTTKFLAKFEVPKYDRRVYVLGCFAKHLTLYSQQVRALNLVKALCETSRLRPKMRVAVIGAGAAGLTAAAGAAVRGATVAVFEQLDGAMECQFNNRQRWLHPFIYDWPNIKKDISDAGLPLLNWQANYAERVAHQIEQAWESLRIHPDLKGEILPVKTGVEKVSITSRKDHVHLNWGSDSGPFDLAILAVGFGLEPHKADGGLWSYWSEDDIDGDFRRPDTRPKWLISGTGDGALTDIMRLCLRRFRHADILSLVQGVAGIAPLRDRLLDLHKVTDEKELHESFLAIENQELQEKLGQRLRQNGPKVTQVGESVYMFGPKASVLNRLIISQLFRIKSFSYFPGRTEKVVWDPRLNKYLVTLSELSETPENRIILPEEPYDRVLQRHGAEKKPLKEGFAGIWAACEDAKLRQEWENTPHHLDETREPSFDASDFPLTAAPVPVSEIASTFASTASPLPSLSGTESDDTFARAVAQFRLYVASLAISKQIRSDGSSTFTYKIEGLRFLSEERLQGVQVRLWSPHGVYGIPVLDEDAQRLRIVWAPDQDPETAEFVAVEADGRSVLSGVLRFPEPVGQKPVRFGFSVDLLNGDAVSAWQFEQMYPPDQRTHMDQEQLRYPMEALARVVWFPVETLTVRVTLPTNITKPATLSIFKASNANEVREEDIVRNSVLYSFPRVDSPKDSGGGKWTRDDGAVANTTLTKSALQSWELSVRQPSVGSCYSLEWELPRIEPTGKLADLARSSLEVRKRLLRYGECRRKNESVDSDIRSTFVQFAKSMTEEFPQKTWKSFEVSLMTYSDEERKLFFFDGSVGGEDLPRELWHFCLPFGVGLAGACFKEADRGFLYLRPESRQNEPNLYLPAPNGVQHEFLLALPIYIPGLNTMTQEELEGKPVERSRFCIGVVNIGSSVNVSWDRNLNYRRIEHLAGKCQDFGDSVCAILANDDNRKAIAGGRLTR
jgi:hypothetical protein